MARHHHQSTNLYEHSDRTPPLPDLAGFGDADGIGFSFKRLARGVGRGVGRAGRLAVKSAGWSTGLTPLAKVARAGLRVATKKKRRRRGAVRARGESAPPETEEPEPDESEETGGDEGGDDQADDEGDGGGDDEAEGAAGLGAMGFSFKKAVRGVGKGFATVGKTIGKGAAAVGREALRDYLGPGEAATPQPLTTRGAARAGGLGGISPWVLGGGAALVIGALLLGSKKKGGAAAAI